MLHQSSLIAMAGIVAANTVTRGLEFGGYCEFKW
jgi:hypothetical protein